VSGQSRRPGGLLRVAAPMTFTRAFLRAVIPRFLAAYPEVQLQLILVSGQYDPLRVEADLLIQTGPLIDSTAGFVKLGSMPQGVFAARKFSKELDPFERPEALQSLPGASLSGRPGPTTWEFTRRQERVRVDLVARLIVPDPILHLEFAAAGLGVALAPVFLAKEVAGEEKLLRLLPDWSPPEVPLFGLYPARTGPAINASVFLESLRRYLRELEA
jgi:DNA-binding transcriptional LysR family regulator